MLELLAPARNADIAIDAVMAGADAVYIGGPGHGARQSAANSVADIARVVAVAHRFNVKVYVTVNTIVYDTELPVVEGLIWELYRVGVDALIVQDMGILRMKLPPIDLHASTQCDIRDAAKARFLRDVGFSRVVLARELSIDEIAAIHREVPDVELEAFCHGALCVSYSGDCRASALTTGRSANRGECAQICRLPFDLVDSKGEVVVADTHLLSLRDLNRLPDVGAMAAAGVTSFKIEGRLKDSSYVRNTVAAYSNALDLVASAGNPRSSRGISDTGFTPDLDRSFNRGFTSYFKHAAGGARGMAALKSPKWVGADTGVVTSVNGKTVTLRLADGVRLANGDGLTFFDRRGKLTGFRVNTANGNRISTMAPVKGLETGMKVYRNYYKEFEDTMKTAVSRRTMWVDMTLRYIPRAGMLVIDAADEGGNRVSETALLPEAGGARIPQLDARRRVLAKTGDTDYRLRNLDDSVGELFIPASTLTDLRRRVLALLGSASRATYKYRYRLPENCETVLPGDGILTIHDNVANCLAEEFYRDHGAREVVRAVEVDAPGAGEDVVVMTTRYCIRRELGMCLKKTPVHRGPLYLKAPGLFFRLDFDCKRCGMNVVKTSKI